MNCIIIEDQMPAQRILKKYIGDIGTLTLIGAFNDAFSAMETLKTEKVELIFLDIHLPRLSGIEFLKTLHSPPPVILTTAFPDYALESYELNVVDYLLKPFSFQRFVKAVSKVAVNGNPISSNIGHTDAKKPLREIFLKSGYDHIKIELDKILFIKSDADYTEVHLGDKMHLSPEPLRYWEELLPEDKYMRIHKSFIINTSQIIKVSGNLVYMEQGGRIPLGRAYKNEFVERFINHK